MRENQLREAEATLSAFVDGAGRGETFVVTGHGRKEAVIVSWEMWQRMTSIPSFGGLLASSPVEEGDIPERDQGGVRDAGL